MTDDKDFYDESKFLDVELGDVVRLKEPYKKGYGKKVVLYRYGIVVEILQVTPRGKVRNVSLHLYTEDARIYLGPNQIPEFVDHYAGEYELYHRAKESGYTPLLPPLTDSNVPPHDEED
jgi:hypothetical protein